MNSKVNFQANLSFAQQMDAIDPLNSFRQEFWIPQDEKGKEKIYFCGNSLGLQPKSAQKKVLQEMDDWAKWGVDGHFHEEKQHPWVSYHEDFSALLAPIVGGKPSEVTAMNSLTTNLHLLMVSFYRPTTQRYKILIDRSAFPSDQYAIASQARFHGFDPKQTVLEFPKRKGEDLLDMEELEKLFQKEGDQIALVIPAGLHFYTGQFFDLKKIVVLSRQYGCFVGFDLAHAAGNVPLSLHDWDVDFAVWCSYKYLNSGPGGVGGCFVHEKHHSNASIPRLEGWWGNKPHTRFEMKPDFEAQQNVNAWQLSNVPILSLASHKASLELFQKAGMQSLRKKSLQLTGFLEYLLQEIPSSSIQQITPSHPKERGCQLSLRVLHENTKVFFERLSESGVVADVRNDVIRVAPTPLYNTFEEVFRFVELTKKCFLP